MRGVCLHGAISKLANTACNFWSNLGLNICLKALDLVDVLRSSQNSIGLRYKK